ncbi:MAG: hypothetical protein K2N49_06615 [Ruminococcus sp.]|nr:hypothetical protein [Ruminococcus sp.]MDE7226509.1 hypothetical protein [Ruminococcus sp.]
MEDIEYIQPNQIGYTELSKEERRFIVKTEGKYIKSLVSISILFVALIFCICLIINSNFNMEYLEPVIMLSVVIWVNICNIDNVKYTASAYGTVIQKDIISQKVIAGRKYRYRRYFIETPHTDKPTVEQEFYYLTLQLDNGKYVRYVNCLREDFISVSKGDTVLAVCYGFNEIKGYLI